MHSKQQDSRAVARSVQFYQLLVRAYPSPFREQYGGLMVQVFQDSCVRANRPESSSGLLALWARTIMDVILSVIEQYANRGADMTKSKWIQISGWLLAASSVFIVVGWAASSRPTYNEANFASWPIDRYLNLVGNPVLAIGLLLIAIGILGMLSRFRGIVSRLGRAGLMVSLFGVLSAVVGIVGMSIQDSSPWWETLMIGITAMFIGLGLFGVNCIQARLFSRWNSLPLLVSLPWPLFILIDMLFSSVINVGFEWPEILIVAMLMITFAGIAAIGYLLQSDVKRSPSSLA